MTLKNFRASDFKKDGSVVEIASSKRDLFAAPVPTSVPIIAPDDDPEDVPAGTVPEILSWVGDDVERAKKALDVETSGDGKPRKGLVSQLKDLIESADDGDEEK